MNPTHRPPFITLGGLDDQEHGKESLKYQKDLDKLYTSERDDCEGMSVTQYQCLLCAYKSSKRWMMRRHVSNVHRQERVSCDLCGKLLKHSGTLEIHLISCRRKHRNSLSCQNNPLSLLKPVSKQEVNSDDREKRNSLISDNTSVSFTKTILTEIETLAPKVTDATLVKQDGNRKRKLREQVSARTNPAVEETEEEKAKRKAEKKAKKKAKKDAEEAANTTLNTTSEVSFSLLLMNCFFVT